MITQEEFKFALEESIKEAGSQTELASRLGMKQSQISDYLRGRFPVENITIGMLFKLFPNTKINLRGVAQTEPIRQSLEDQLLHIYRHLTDTEKVKCLTIIAAHFPGLIIKETKQLMQKENSGAT